MSRSQTKTPCCNADATQVQVPTPSLTCTAARRGLARFGCPGCFTVTALEKSIEKCFAMMTTVEALQACKPVRAGVCG